MEDLTREFFEKIGITPDAVTSSVDNDCEIISVTLSGSAEQSMLAFGGERLYAAEHLLRIMRPEESEQSRFRLDINGFRVAKESSVRDLATAMAKRVLEDGLPRDLPAMNPAERRVAHIMIKETFPSLETDSRGEEPNRCLVIREA